MLTAVSSSFTPARSLAKSCVIWRQAGCSAGGGRSGARFFVRVGTVGP
jgi:hypothetical protein